MKQFKASSKQPIPFSISLTISQELKTSVHNVHLVAIYALLWFVGESDVSELRENHISVITVNGSLYVWRLDLLHNIRMSLRIRLKIIRVQRSGRSLFMINALKSLTFAENESSHETDFIDILKWRSMYWVQKCSRGLRRQ